MPESLDLLLAHLSREVFW